MVPALTEGDKDSQTASRPATELVGNELRRQQIADFKIAGFHCALLADSHTMRCDGLTGSPGKSQKEGQEDQGRVK